METKLQKVWIKYKQIYQKCRFFDEIYLYI